MAQRFDAHGHTMDDMNASPTPSEPVWGKVPAVTLWFWVIKIAATTLGETGGDTVTMSMNLGYLIGTLMFVSAFAVAVTMQLAVRGFHAFLFWAVIVATTTAGTTLSDFLDRSLGVGYAGGSALLSIALVATLLAWKRYSGTVDMAAIASRKAEAFYWVTILFSQTLGTALGDWVADDQGGLGLGYGRCAALFGAALALVAAAYCWTRISRVGLFWAAFVLSRPLGAAVGDFLDKPHASGGLALSRVTASAVLAAFIVASIVLFPQQAERRPT